jgi:hypothetical protein
MTVDPVFDSLAHLFLTDDVSVTENKDVMINVGSWNPTAGLVMTDVLFPHSAHGFRGRTFHIISYHVGTWGLSFCS